MSEDRHVFKNTINVGRDMRGDINIAGAVSSSRSGGLSRTEREQVVAALTDFLHRDESLSAEPLQYREILESTIRELNQGKTDKPRLRAALGRIEDILTGTSASLFAATVVAQLPWVWTIS